MSSQKKLSDLATVIRSKNAGPFLTTCDIFFEKKEYYYLVKKLKVLDKKPISRVLKVDEKKILGVYFFDDILGVKITLVKQGDIASGDLLCGDIFGMQQYIPLMELLIPEEVVRGDNKSMA